jgi:hypothetical protein
MVGGLRRWQLSLRIEWHEDGGGEGEREGRKEGKKGRR